MASTTSSNQVRQNVTMGSYVRLPCRRCGQHTWTSEPAECVQCGRCRNGLSPVTPALLPGASTVDSPQQDKGYPCAARTAPACPICFEAEAAKVEYASVANESWENSDRCDAHGICKPCLRRYVEVKVLEEGIWNLRCPGESCTYRLINDDISEAVVESERREEVLTLHSHLRNENFAPRLEEMLACQRSVAADSTRELDTCEAMLLAECQVCPNCCVLVRREGGCTHIVCRCGQDFCFGCGGPISDDSDDCCCEERDDTIPDEDEMGGEGAPAFAFWQQRKKQMSDEASRHIATSAASEGDLATNLPEREEPVPELKGAEPSVDFPTLLCPKSAEEPPKLIRAASLP
eukprot:TRINITY_DN5729_c0_g2_i1.p1 TRINITY_DN5729_c0_g2~~TRINITY_DN5729_c0_g2_i1.p1  ORF type:complete len:348 (-),score=59.16 TRINITY_DN5729_c0_g2_i1:98-1141(-)